MTEREVGQILEGLRHLQEGQARIETTMHEHFLRLGERITQHEKEDDQRFTNVWKRLGTLSSRIAVFSGGTIVLWALFKLSF